MLRKYRSAVADKRNLLGRKVRGRLSILDVVKMEALGLSKADFLDLLDRGWLLPALRGAATTSSNTTLANPVYFPRALVVSTDQTINQGDLVWWDPVNFTLKALSAATQVAVSSTGGYCGAASGASNPNVYPDPAAGTPSEKASGIVVQRGGTVKVSTTTGEGNYFPFEPVTIGADAQTVTRGGQTSANRVGLIIIPPPVTPRGTPGATPTSETLASGTAGELWLEPKFPDTVLL